MLSVLLVHKLTMMTATSARRECDHFMHQMVQQQQQVQMMMMRYMMNDNNNG